MGCQTKNWKTYDAKVLDQIFIENWDFIIYPICPAFPSRDEPYKDSCSCIGN